MGQLWDLWVRWWSGEKVDGAHLWGLPVLAWARIGKGLQFAAGLTVVLDLVGPDRLRAFGQRLLVVNWTKKVTRPAEVMSLAVGLLTFLVYVGVVVLMVTSTAFDWAEDVARPVKQLFEWAKPVINSFWFLAPVTIILFFITLAWVTEGKPKNRAQARDEANTGCLLAPVILVTVIVVGILLLPWILFLYGICWPLSRGLAFLLDHKRPGWILYLVAVVFFVIGFHFDMLGS